MAETGKEAERRRLAEALRANLRRRKAARAAPAARRTTETATDDRAATPSGDSDRG